MILKYPTIKSINSTLNCFELVIPLTTTRYINRMESGVKYVDKELTQANIKMYHYIL